jgi:hypothetical protein
MESEILSYEHIHSSKDSAVDPVLYYPTVLQQRISTTTTTTATNTVANQICEYTNFISFLSHLQQQLERDDDTAFTNLRQRSMEILTTITTREEIYTVDKLKD